MPKTVLMILLMYLVLLDISLQDNGEKSNEEYQNITSIRPRSFNGRRMATKIIPPEIKIMMETDSFSFSPTPSLELDPLANDTASYFTGVLSTRVIPAIYIVAIIIGIPSNTIVLVALSSKTKAFSAAILYFSLALSDLLFLLTLTLRVFYHFNGNHWVFGEAACRVVTACFYGNVYCSINTLMCISIKRYLATVHPFTYKSLPKHSCTLWSSLMVWFLFFTAMVPELLITQSYHLPQLGITSCHDVLPLNDKSFSFLPYYKLTLICMGFFVPFIVTVISHVSIIYQLNKAYDDWMYFIKMSTLVFIIFTVCFMPSNVIHFIHYVKLYTSTEEHFYVYYSVAMCLCGFHSCLDPFLFSFMSRSTGSKLYFITFKGKT
ncbi:proteinase-activated receptor 3-like [Conger conger]|uniref:proteinase-activated receptor 3-like n=1 Tax=Conger conger TaxID=82655 RepID=UPI002A5990A2|nr:proteinase-activated receptor 3-like [Conger conger]